MASDENKSHSMIVSNICRRGRSALFADTGLGKTLMQLSWRIVFMRSHKSLFWCWLLCAVAADIERSRRFKVWNLVLNICGLKETECMIHVNKLRNV